MSTQYRSVKKEKEWTYIDFNLHMFIDDAGSYIYINKLYNLFRLFFPPLFFNKKNYILKQNLTNYLERKLPINAPPHK